MLGAARKLFHRKGFDATSTREISIEAGVSESMLFRHFGSKNAIFQEAVLKPFVEFVQQYISDWTLLSTAARQPERLAHSYVSGLFQLCRDHLDLMSFISATRPSHPDNHPGADARLLIHEQLDALVMQVGRHHAERGIQPVMDPQLSVRFAIAMVVGAAQLGPEFFGVGERLTDEIAAFVVRGAGNSPAQQQCDNT